MKKIYFICLLCITIASCESDPKKTTTENNDPQTETAETYQTISGGFLYTADAAVLKSGNKIYAVTIDEMMHKLDDQCKQYKKNTYDMVPVVIKGNIIPNPNDEGWKEAIEVKEIISVQKPSEEDGTIIIKNNQ